MNSVLGIHEHALLLREKRSEILASNLVNADTPNYKARDIDFNAYLQSMMGQQSATHLTTTQVNHLAALNSNETAVQYRIPMQDSFDGNTVDSQIEQGKFTENAMHYLATLNFLKAKTNNILLALKGD